MMHPEKEARYKRALRQLNNSQKNLYEAGSEPTIDVKMLAAADVIGATRNVLIYGKAFLVQLKHAIRNLEKEVK